LSFEQKNLNLLAYTNGFSMHHYRTEDSSDELDWSLYFTEAGDRLKNGDMIICSCKDRGETFEIRKVDLGWFSQRWGK